MSKGNFRQYIHKFRKIIQIEVKSNPCFYKLRGLNVSTRNIITDEDKGAIMFSLLENIKSQPASIHDLKINFSTNLHEKLLEVGYSENNTNKGIKLVFPSFEPNVIVKGMVYPNSIHLDLGCSFQPFVYGISGALNLTSLLGQIRLYLVILYGNRMLLPPVSEWILTHFHFGKDSTQIYNGKSFHMTFEDAFYGMVRFYSKKYSDGKVLPRLESIKTPNVSVAEEISKMLNV